MRIFRRTPHSSSLIHVHCEDSIKPFVQERNLSSWSTAFFHQMSILAKGNDGTGRIRKNVLLILIRQESSEILIFERINSSNAARNCSSLLIPIDSRRFLFAYSSSIRIAVYFAFRCFFPDYKLVRHLASVLIRRYIKSVRRLVIYMRRMTFFTIPLVIGHYKENESNGWSYPVK
jgi:hypothetical protein